MGLVVLLLLIGFWVYRVQVRIIYDEWQTPALPEAIDYSNVIASTQAGINSAKQSYNRIEENTGADGLKRDDKIASVASTLPRNDNTIIPIEYNLDVPFQSQAPFANWDMPYQEACEEAALIMTARFFNGQTLSADQMDAEIKKLVDWEVKRFGYYQDTPAAEVVIIAKEYFGLNATVDTNVTVDNIKRQIAANKLVLVPAAGKVLPNPNFRNGGPLYHMLVIRGYTADRFITNDPGTKRGKEFTYRYDDLLYAVHDWPADSAGKPTEAEMLTGRKVMIVVDK